MRIVVLDTWPCEPRLGGERFQGLTATASTGDQLGERAVIASLVVVWGATRLSSSRIDGLGRGFQRIGPRCLEGARSRPGVDDVDGCGDAACHISMVRGKTDDPARSPVPDQRS
ncbi:hypothetical protein U6P04_04875 [Cutibacterium acnes]|nr:hypothetical protein [Cutibacterium acnes]MBU5410122.1 hypothetical protein [Cutibacterium acnes]RKI34390.1 hypothetical protein D7V70_04220 [Cutibacterium acnes]